MRYQYKVITARDADGLEALLNNYGAEGWKLDEFDIRSTNTGTFFAAVMVKSRLNS